MSIKIKTLIAGHSKYVNGKLKWERFSDRFGNLGVQFRVENTDETRTVKYVRVKLVCKNLVGDVEGEKIVEVTGPISPKKSEGIWDTLLNAALHTYTFENLWRVQKFGEVEVAQVEVEYTDGATEVIDGKEATYDPNVERNAEKLRSFKNFKRSSKGRLVGGICSAIGERLGVTPWIFRVLFTLAQPAGIMLYIILCLTVPKE